MYFKVIIKVKVKLKSMNYKKLNDKKTRKLAVFLYKSVAKKRVYSESRFIIGERVLGL